MKPHLQYWDITWYYCLKWHFIQLKSNLPVKMLTIKQIYWVLYTCMCWKHNVNLPTVIYDANWKHKTWETCSWACATNESELKLLLACTFTCHDCNHNASLWHHSYEVIVFFLESYDPQNNVVLNIFDVIIYCIYVIEEPRWSTHISCFYVFLSVYLTNIFVI